VIITRKSSIHPAPIATAIRDSIIGLPVRHRTQDQIKRLAALVGELVEAEHGRWLNDEFVEAHLDANQFKVEKK
jgi:hypothetical protein